MGLMIFAFLGWDARNLNFDFQACICLEGECMLTIISGQVRCHVLCRPNCGEAQHYAATLGVLQADSRART